MSRSYSAKYGFIRPDFIINGSYNVTFKDRSSREVITIKDLRKQIEQMGLDKYKEIIVLGGKDYADKVKSAFSNKDIRIREPVKGLPIGKRIKKVKEAVDKGKEL